MNKITVEECKADADKHRGRYVTSGPFWPMRMRYVFLFDEVIRLRSALAEIAENAGKHNADWCRRRAESALSGGVQNE